MGAFGLSNHAIESGPATMAIEVNRRYLRARVTFDS